MSVTDGVRADGAPPADPQGGEPRHAGAGGSARDGFGGSRPASAEGVFDRTPPQDVAAEQCVLGGMLLSKDAIADVVEVLRSHDFYRPNHSVIFEAVLDLYGRGEPADPITVAAALADSGDLGRVGGAAYLHTLIASVPTAANAAYYAKIVSDRAVLRRLVEAGTRVVQLGYGAAAGGGRDIDDVVDMAQQAVYDVTERRVSEDFAVLAEMLQPTLDEIEAVGTQGGVMTGVPTGFTDLDRLLNGLHSGQLIVVAGRPGLGKALALDTPLPTPAGWTTMGRVKAGDQLLGADGRPTTVVVAFDVAHDRACFEVEFCDGSRIVADADHLWRTVVPVGGSGSAGGSQSVGAPVPVALAHSAGRHGSDASRPGHLTLPERTLPDLTLPDRPHEPSVDAATAQGRPPVVTTAQIAASLRSAADGRFTHAVPACRPLYLPHRDDLPVPPYALGVWLGGGHLGTPRFTAGDPELADCVAAEGVRVEPSGPRVYEIVGAAPEPAIRPGCPRCGAADPATATVRRCTRCRRFGSFAAALRAAGVLHDKHIPPRYLRAAEAQRRALLSGLLDADGTVSRSGRVGLRVDSRRFADGVRELLVSLGYRCRLTVDPVSADARATTRVRYTLSFGTTEEIFRVTPKRAAHRGVRCAAGADTAQVRLIVAVRPVPSVPVRCVAVDSADHLYLAGPAMIPTHNSTAAMDFARAAAVRNNLASAIFSLEMSKVEIVMRLLSAEARVPLHVLRSGQLSDDDWTKLARRMGEISEAPLFVDDTPNMTLMEIRAKARRLRQRHDLKLVVVDYLQLMTSPKRVESRQQEVAELSRGLKLLAKEVECPVVAVSQLNRGPEQRNDKRPQLSDLRESGCMPACTRLLRADTGQEITLGELVATQHQPTVLSVDDRNRLVPSRLTRAFASGVKPVFRLRLHSGREVDATANHRFLTINGWTRLDELGVGSAIAVPRLLPAPMRMVECDDDGLIRLAHLLGRRGIGPNGVTYPTADPDRTAVEAAAERAFGTAEPYGPWGPCPDTTFMPEALFGLPDAQLARFLRHLWTGATVRASFTASSRRLADNLQRALLRFEVRSRLVPTGGYDPGRGWDVVVEGTADRARLMRCLGTTGEPGGRASGGRINRQVAAGVGARYGGSDVLGHQARQRTFAPHPGVRVAEMSDSAEPPGTATADVHWDALVAVEPLGRMPVFDATVEGTHNFIANGVVAHNSIEQDADVVILLHRDDYYDKESPRAGEADFIVAKHRNGPTDTITVAAQLHLSRFVDMAVV